MAFAVTQNCFCKDPGSQGSRRFARVDFTTVESISCGWILFACMVPKEVRRGHQPP